MHFEFHRRDDWPSLSWLATCCSDGKVVVHHGPRVETYDDWFCEAAWDGDFERGAFDRTSIIAGSGGRIRNGAVTFVTSGTTIDRIHHTETMGRVVVSNSLPCILSAADTSLIPSYRRYQDHVLSIVRGIRSYDRQIPTTKGVIYLTYFDNLVWRPGRIEREPKALDPHTISSFKDYKEYLLSTLARVIENATSPARSVPLRPRSTLSSGYDSTAVSALASEVGCRDVLCFDSARGGFGDDNGLPIAQYLGLNATVISSTSWRDLASPEIPFIIGDGVGGEVIYASARRELTNTLLLTGHHGDYMWGMHTRALGPDLVRTDQSGLGLTEYRLIAGFQNVALPFWHARQIGRIVAISNSPELEPWVLSGTDYNRPICRRIVEEAGVPREMFGVRKKAAALLLGREDALTPGSVSMHSTWLRENRGDWLRHARLPPNTSVHFDSLRARTRLGIDRFVHRGEGFLRSRSKPLSRMFEIMPPSRIGRLVTGDPEFASTLHRYRFAWACDVHKEKYPDARSATH